MTLPWSSTRTSWSAGSLRLAPKQHSRAARHNQLRRVEIKGGHGVAHAGTANIYTPNGVITEVSQEDMDFLNTDPSFQKFVERGFLKVLEKNPKEEAVAGMTRNMKRDASSPATPTDFQQGGRFFNPGQDGVLVKPTTGPVQQ